MIFRDLPASNPQMRGWLQDELELRAKREDTSEVLESICHLLEMIYRAQWIIEQTRPGDPN